MCYGYVGGRVVNRAGQGMATRSRSRRRRGRDEATRGAAVSAQVRNEGKDLAALAIGDGGREGTPLLKGVRGRVR